MEYCTVNCGSIFIQQYSENSKFSFTVQPNLYIVKLLIFFQETMLFLYSRVYVSR